MSEVEDAVVGAVLSSSRALREVVGIVDAGDFDSEHHRNCYTAALELFDAGRPVDVVTVAAEMRRRGTLPPKGPVFLRDLAESCPLPASAAHYAAQMRAEAMLRRVKAVGRTIAGLQGDADDVAQQAVEMLRAATAKPAVADVAELDRMIETTAAEIERDAESPTVVATRIPRLDHLLDGGLHGSRLYILGARPGVGKSALATNITRTALEAGRKVLFVSLEMTGREVLGRLLADRFSIDTRDVNALARAMFDDRIRHWPLWFMERGNILTITARARDIRPDLIVIDYVQLLPTVGRHERRDLEIGSYSRTLKHLAVELRTPVLTLAQLNRGAEGRVDRRPRLSDLRESGSLECDPDTVLLMHRDTDQESREALLSVLKNRHGPTGAVKLVFDSVHTRFREMERL